MREARMLEPTTKCRRCSECENYSHHWTPDPMDPEDPEWEPGDYACKHCDQRGNSCVKCDGTGITEDETPCLDCNEEGVIPLSPEEVSIEHHRRNCPSQVFTCDSCGRVFSEFEFADTIEEFLCENCASGFDPDDPEYDEDV